MPIADYYREQYDKSNKRFSLAWDINYHSVTVLLLAGHLVDPIVKMAVIENSTNSRIHCMNHTFFCVWLLYCWDLHRLQPYASYYLKKNAIWTLAKCFARTCGLLQKWRQSIWKNREQLKGANLMGSIVLSCRCKNCAVLMVLLKNVVSDIFESLRCTRPTLEAWVPTLVLKTISTSKASILDHLVHKVALLHYRALKTALCMENRIV